MNFIKNQEELLENLYTLEEYLNSDKTEEREFALDLVRRGKTIIAYNVNGVDHFAPSRFSGYKDNSLRKHEENEEKDGRDTNPVIDSIIGRSFSNGKIESKFIDYCTKLGIKVPNNKRKYWRLKENRENLELGNKISVLL